MPNPTCPDCGGRWRPIYGSFDHALGCTRALRRAEARRRLRDSHEAEDTRSGVVATKVLRDPYRDLDGRDISTPEQGE